MKSFWLALVAVLLGATAVAQPLAGKKITLDSGAHKSLNVPVALPYEGEPVQGQVRVVHESTGKSFPATIRNGELVFVPEGAMPKQSLGYTIEVEDVESPPAPRVRIEKQEGKDILDVYIEDVHFTSYHYSNDWKKPFLWPVHDETGEEITRGYPMDPESLPKDHPHHKSIWTAHGDVNGADCWGEGENSGFQHSEEVTFGSGDAYGWIKAKNVWQDKDHKPVVTEEREYRFYATPAKGRLFDEFITFSADYGDVKFGDTKEGGLVSIRMRPELSEKPGGAVITNAQGDQGMPNLWGKPSAWTDYSGTLENVGARGIAIFDHPENLRHPTSWHARDYGLNGANPFGYSYFIEKEYNKDLMPPNGDYTIKAGDKLELQYRIYVHSGDVKEAAVADRYADFATPPKVAWTE